MPAADLLGGRYVRISRRDRMRQFVSAVVAAVFIVSSPAAHADFGDFLVKLLAQDGQAGDQLGESVAAGDVPNLGMIFAGAINDNEYAGSAYIFDAFTGRQIGNLVAEDAVAIDRLGWDIAVGGAPGAELLIAGAPGVEPNGAAYLFNVASGQQIAKLLPEPEDENSYFGRAVAINRDPARPIAVVGARNSDDHGLASGSAYVFDVRTGEQLYRLFPNDPRAFAEFGSAVAVSDSPVAVGESAGGAIILVGAQQQSDVSGAAYLFNAASGVQLVKLLPSDPQPGDDFGRNVAIDTAGRVAIVGAPGYLPRGRAYLYDVATGIEIAMLQGEPGPGAAVFGSSVDVDGDLAIVGAWAENAAYIFDADSGRELARLTPPGSSPAFFGWSVAINDAIAVVGHRGDSELGVSAGALFVFDAYCPADLTRDDEVGPADLAVILANWGPVPPGDTVADLNADGSVGPADLATVLDRWGPCRRSDSVRRSRVGAILREDE